MLVGDPNFIRSVLGPFLCPYLYDKFLWDGNICEAVNLWWMWPYLLFARGRESVVLRSRSGEEEVWPHQPMECLICDRYAAFARQGEYFQ